MTYSYEIDKLQYLQIGQEGNNLERYIEIDLSSWVEEYPDVALSPFVLFKAPDADIASAATSTWNSETNILTWEVTAAVTAVAGQGYTEIRVLDTDAALESAEQYSGLVKKSKVIPTYIGQSISGIIGGTRPSPYEDFLNQVLAIKTQMNNVFQEAVTEYAISDSGSAAPGSGWSTTIPTVSDMKGKFLWTRVTFNWGTGESSRIHIVNFVPDDTEGDVRTVNGFGGTVVLDAGDIAVDKQAEVAETIAAALARIDASAKILPLVNSASAVSGAPDATDFLLVGKSDGTGVTRKRLSDVLSAASIKEASGGYVIKMMDVTLTRYSYYARTFATTSSGVNVRVRRGHYQGIASLTQNDIPLTVLVGEFATPYYTQLGTMESSWQPGLGGYNIVVPYEQSYAINADEAQVPSDSLTLKLVYLAAT